MSSLRRIGEWERVGRLVRDLGPNIKKAGTMSLMRWGLKAERIAIEHLSAQDLDWKPLAPYTLSQKISRGGSELTLIDTHTYFRNITSWVEDWTAYVGVKRGLTSKDGKVDLGLIAATHEYGSSSGRIPARPLWTPTFTEVMKWHVDFNQPVMHLANILSKY